MCNIDQTLYWLFEAGRSVERASSFEHEQLRAAVTARLVASGLVPASLLTNAQTDDTGASSGSFALTVTSTRSPC